MKDFKHFYSPCFKLSPLSQPSSSSWRESPVAPSTVSSFIYAPSTLVGNGYGPEPLTDWLSTRQEVIIRGRRVEGPGLVVRFWWAVPDNNLLTYLGRTSFFPHLLLLAVIYLFLFFPIYQQ